MKSGRLFCSFCGTHEVTGDQLTRITFDRWPTLDEWDACPLCTARIRNAIHQTFSKPESEE